MSLATQLGLDQPHAELPVLASARWVCWQQAHPALGVCDDLLSAREWTKQANAHESNGRCSSILLMAQPCQLHVLVAGKIRRRDVNMASPLVTARGSERSWLPACRGFLGRHVGAAVCSTPGRTWSPERRVERRSGCDRSRSSSGVLKVPLSVSKTRTRSSLSVQKIDLRLGHASF